MNWINLVQFVWIQWWVINTDREDEYCKDAGQKTSFYTWIDAGHTLYHGPRKDIMDFFRSMGFDLPERKGIPDFLQEVSGLKDQQVS